MRLIFALDRRLRAWSAGHLRNFDHESLSKILHHVFHAESRLGQPDFSFGFPSLVLIGTPMMDIDNVSVRIDK